MSRSDRVRRARVYCLGVPAGELSELSEGGFEFRYLPDYLENPRLPSISLTFPRQPDPYRSPVLFSFFFGLLAEGENKAIQCRVLQIDERDHFTRLLRTCATETIGGVTVRELQ